MAMEQHDFNDPQHHERLRSMFGPQQVDQQIRQAIQMCWMSLPSERQTVDEVEAQVRRVLDRAIKDLREDADSFECE